MKTWRNYSSGKRTKQKEIEGSKDCLVLYNCNENSPYSESLHKATERPLCFCWHGLPNGYWVLVGHVTSSFAIMFTVKVNFSSSERVLADPQTLKSTDLHLQDSGRDPWQLRDCCNCQWWGPYWQCVTCLAQGLILFDSSETNMPYSWNKLLR